MPFESYAQEAYLKHNHPSIYKRWSAEHGTKVAGNVQRVRALKKRSK